MNDASNDATLPNDAESPAFSAGTAGFAIRRAEPRDAACLADLAAETFPLACPPHTSQANIAEFIAANLTRAHFESYLGDESRILFIATPASDGGDPIAYTMLIVGEPGDPDVAAALTARPTAELSKVYARASAHGTGVARAIVEATVAAAAERGAKGVWLGVNQENERANRFYEKAGFALVGTKRFKVGDRFEDDYTRERTL